MRKLSIENLERRPRTFNLPHHPVCIRLGRCQCVDGKPKALHLRAGGLLTGLPEAYASAPEIEAAVNAKPRPTVRLVVKEVAEKKAAAKSAKAKEQPATSTDQDQTSEKKKQSEKSKGKSSK